VKRRIQQVEDQGLEALVRELLEDAPDQEAEFQQTFERIRNDLMDFSQADQLQAWWCYRMLRTRTPLKEKITLFWHGHFTTSLPKVEDAYLVHRQIEMLRTHGLGNFRDLLRAVCHDPAMLVYLDSDANSKEHPNENFARELMELFTIGVGNYTEVDVREAARAFTGWTREGAEFHFNTDQHDNGFKQFQGHNGRLNGNHIMDILLQHSALPHFLARKLLVFFANPQPSEEVVAEAGRVLKEGGLNIKHFLNALFLSRYFHSPVCRGTRIASPVEYVVGACRSLGVRMSATQVRTHLVAMGQELLAPPTVKGWDGEKKWINTNAWAARTAFAQELADLTKSSEFSPHLDIEQLVPGVMTDPKDIVDQLAGRLLDGRLPPDKRAELARYMLLKEGKPNREAFQSDDDFRAHQTRNAVAVLLSLPEYHTI
jgi:uncharacterized protein (DUF1800 family)